MSSWRRPGWGLCAGLALFAGGWVSQAEAEPRKFDLEDPLGRNAIALTMESRYQPIRGFCEETRGELSFDPETGHCSGTLEIVTEAIRFSGDELTRELVGPDWFDFASRPQWAVTIKDVAHAQRLDEETWQIAALGAMSLRGRAGGLNFPATITYLPGGMTERSGGIVKGDIIILRGRLSFPRGEFGVHPGADDEDVYGEEIDLEFSLVGWASGAGGSH